MKERILFTSLLILMSSCASRKIVPVSLRSDGFDKPNGKLKSAGSHSPDTNKPPQLYTKQTEVSVEPMQSPNESGSLFKLDDGRNHLFSSDEPMTVGRQIMVEIRSTRSKPKDPKKGAKDPKAKEEADELIKQFPDLEPAESDMQPITRFKMKVTHRLENGDVIALLTRQSITEADAQTVKVEARIPYQRLIANEIITTDDLADVEWFETNGTETVERRSSGWEDEYTMRLSGFNEAKSRSALALEDKRKALMNIRDQMKTRLTSANKERETMAKQREEMLEQQRKNSQEMDEMKKKVDQTTAELDKYKKDEEERKKKEEEEKAKAEEAKAKESKKDK